MDEIRRSIMWQKNYSLMVKKLKMKDPRRRIEYLMIITLICIGYFYIYIYQNMISIDVPFIGLESLIELPIIAIIVIPLVKLIIVKSDPLQRSPSKNKTIRFFQNEFPSNYIFDRCQTCIENERSCINYIKPGSYAHMRYWFKDLFHGKIEFLRINYPRLWEMLLRKGLGKTIVDAKIGISIPNYRVETMIKLRLCFFDRY